MPIMKSIFSLLNSAHSGKRARNLAVLARLFFILIFMVGIYSVIFQFIMQYENQEHSWVSAVYWCLVVMSTLGFGDVTFHSDLGRVFSILVLLSGTFFMLMLLPFFFIQFFFIPWMESQATKRAPRKVASDLKDHVILTGLGEIERALISRLEKCKVAYVVIVSDISEALLLNDEGYPVIVGELDDIHTYENARISDAALVVATRSDTINSNIAFTVKEICPTVPVVSTATFPASVDILKLAGCNRVLQLGEMLGKSFSRRIIGRDGTSHVIGEFGDLLVAEAVVLHPELIDKPLREVKFRNIANITISGIWERGRFKLAGPETVLTKSSVVILSGSKSQLASYDAYFGMKNISSDPYILIIGGGKVGRAVAAELESQKIDYRIIDKDASRIRKEEKYTYGDAADIEVLREAGIDKASTILLTTHDDDMNVYLTIYCRKLRPEVQLISRSNVERNISTLHRAGADFVLSYAAVGANALFNLLQKMDTILLTEGLSAFRVTTPSVLVNKSLRESALRELTGCSVIAVIRNAQHEINPDPDKLLGEGSELIVMGDTEAESKFMGRFSFEELRFSAENDVTL